MKIIWVLLAFLPTCLQLCHDKPECFQKQFFQFIYPDQNLYQLQQYTSNNNTTFDIKAYADFNNDLKVDMVVLGIDGSLSILKWNDDVTLYEEYVVVNTSECEVHSVYLYDINDDGRLDMTLWGEQNNNSCVVPYFQVESLTFQSGNSLTMNLTTQPIIMSYGTSGISKKITGLLVFMNNARTMLKYDNFQGKYIPISWATIFSDEEYESIPFGSPHWNSFVDVTSDCRGDLVLCDDADNIQFWVSNGSIFVFNGTVTVDGLAALTLTDLNYDGAIDMLVLANNTLQLYENPKYLQATEEFCCTSCGQTISFPHTPTTITKLNKTHPAQYLHIGDINIDGYPDILCYYKENSTVTPIIYTNEQNGQFTPSNDYNKELGKVQEESLVVSFLDILENGILDVMISDGVSTLAYYNNYLHQNQFFIKGYAAETGQIEDEASVLVGVSFFWVNSVGDAIRVAYAPQMWQTAYSALQVPYAYCGLGRANNYVESFTVGMLGQSHKWSPIIPNSQLVTYLKGSDAKQQVYVLYQMDNPYICVADPIPHLRGNNKHSNPNNHGFNPASDEMQGIPQEIIEK